MIVLGISGSLRGDSHNTRLLRAAARELPDEVEFRLFDGLRDVPPYDEDDDRDPAPAAVRAAAGGDRRGGRGALRHARVQLVDPRAAQERPRLGIAAARHEPAPVHAGRRRRGQHRRLRGRVGPGRAPQGAGGLGRAGGGGRPRPRSRAREVRRRTVRSTTSSGSSCASCSRSCCRRSGRRPSRHDRGARPDGHHRGGRRRGAAGARGGGGRRSAGPASAPGERADRVGGQLRRDQEHDHGRDRGVVAQHPLADGGQRGRCALAGDAPSPPVAGPPRRTRRR